MKILQVWWSWIFVPWSRICNTIPKAPTDWIQKFTSPVEKFIFELDRNSGLPEWPVSGIPESVIERTCFTYHFRISAIRKANARSLSFTSYGQRKRRQDIFNAAGNATIKWHMINYIHCWTGIPSINSIPVSGPWIIFQPQQGNIFHVIGLRKHITVCNLQFHIFQTTAEYRAPA